jgi:hypothetical protein
MKPTRAVNQRQNEGEKEGGGEKGDKKIKQKKGKRQ